MKCIAFKSQSYLIEGSSHSISEHTDTNSENQTAAHTLTEVNL